MSTDLDIQGAWSGDSLHDTWRHTRDGVFLLQHARQATIDLAGWGGSGRLLDVAAAEAEVTCQLARNFDSAIVLEPSPTMLVRARDNSHRYQSQLGLIRGIAETLPFPDGAFDCVLCHSALDHFADPERGIREMARVLKPDGRMVLTFVNYGGIAPRVARGLYAAARQLRLVPPLSDSQRLPWDSPVPYEHNFECTWQNVSAMCAPYLDLDWARGVSLGWGFPGWGSLLARMPVLERTIDHLDRFAQPRPALADFVVSAWRPRARATWPVDDYRVRSTNPVHQRLIRDEASYWAQADFAAFFGVTSQSQDALLNTDLTGDPARSWFDDLVARGPFRDAAVLGCDDVRREAAWLQRGGSPRLDVYELSAGVIAKVAPQLGELRASVRFIETDLNFAELPEAIYDCVWASSTMHCFVNLEHVLNQVQRALRPGGIFAIHGWVGENRLQYSAHHLDRANAVLAQVPRPYRRVDVIERPSPAWSLSPYAAVRSQEIRALARTHQGFDLIHEGLSAWLFPLTLVVDGEGLARDRPDVLQTMRAAELEARMDPLLQPTYAYLVLRRR